MPEGDTVWLSARRMHEALAGHRLTRTDFRVPALATIDLSGHDVVEVVPRGKHMLTRVSGGLTLHTHFMLTGAWRLVLAGSRRGAGPAHEIRVILETEPWRAVGLRIPVVELIATAHEPDILHGLGPDLLGDDWDESEAVRRIRADPGREVGPALLDQANLAGIGNLYKTEGLFLSGITPWTTVADVADLTGLVRRTRRLMFANRDHWPQSTTGDLRRGRDHWVFERYRQPCRRCGSEIRIGKQGTPPYDRLCYWCPACQAGPAPASGASAAASRLA
jgi:endonuclease VIII